MKWVEYVAYMGLMRNVFNERQFSQSNPNTLYPPSLTSSFKPFYKVRKKAPIAFVSFVLLFIRIYQTCFHWADFGEI
jgi:hypothetical protein